MSTHTTHASNKFAQNAIEFLLPDYGKGSGKQHDIKQWCELQRRGRNGKDEGEEGVNNAQVPTVMPRLDLATRTVSASATSQPARYLAARVRM